MAKKTRLIDANALKQKLQSHYDFFVKAYGGFCNLQNNDKIRVDEISNCIAEIVNAPTIDAELVRHGYWFMTEYEYFNCSVCGGSYSNGCESAKEARYKLKNGYYYCYCPHCGAKMTCEE